MGQRFNISFPDSKIGENASSIFDKLGRKKSAVIIKLLENYIRLVNETPLYNVSEDDCNRIAAKLLNLGEPYFIFNPYMFSQPIGNGYYPFPTQQQMPVPPVQNMQNYNQNLNDNNASSNSDNVNNYSEQSPVEQSVAEPIKLESEYNDTENNDDDLDENNDTSTDNEEKASLLSNLKSFGISGLN